jgi:hypothetical protein
MLIGRLMKAELIEDAGHVPLDSGHGDDQLVGDADIGTTFGDQRQDLPLAWRKVIDRTGFALAPDQPGDHVRIKHRAAVGDAAHGIGEHAQIADLLLQHVPDTLSAVGDQVERVTVLEELRQDQYAYLRSAGPDLKCRPEPVIAMIRGHLDVGNDDIRAVGAGHPDQVARVSRRTDHVESPVLEDVYDPFPHEGLVLADDDANLLGRTHGTKLCRGPAGATTRVQRGAVASG